MLKIPADSPSIITTLATDPGTTKLGVSLMHICLDTRLIISTEATTLNGDKLANNFLLETHYGHRHSRISGMMDYVYKMCVNYRPFAIISESPFYNPSRPAAFEALMDVISALRLTVANYDIFKPLLSVDPSSVKNAVGAKGGSNKVTIQEAVSNISEINYHDPHEFKTLDEHAIDSIAVNYWYYSKFIRK